MTKICIIAAVDKGLGIGLENQLLYKIPEDLKRFRELTWASTVLMGRNTWESLPDKFRPLPMRHNLVLSSDPNFVAKGATVVRSVQEALSITRTDELFVIGGQRVYAETLNTAERLFITEIEAVSDADAFFPIISPDVFEIETSTGFSGDKIKYRFINYVKKNAIRK
jgi:dihydrofolate reductase